MNILVVEDNPDLNRSIINLLTAEGYTAQSAASIEEVNTICRAQYFELILLDIMLPDGYGYTIIDSIRNGFPSRVIMLSALSDVESKKICYESGADDYITKPFDMDELLFKIQAITRQFSERDSQLTLGDVTINYSSSQLCRGDQSVPIPPSQLRLLTLLLRKHREGRTMSVDDVTAGTDDAETDARRRVRTLVTRTRLNLEQVGSQQVRVVASYGKGYHLEIRR